MVLVLRGDGVDGFPGGVTNRTDAYPESVDVDAPARPPVTDPTLGIPVPRVDAPAEHRLVVIGDSIWQGMQSGGLSRTEWSPGAIVARHAGFEFRHARFDAGGGTGIPMDLERVLRHLEDKYGAEVGPLELPHALVTARALMGESEKYWEGVGTRLRTTVIDGPMNHNLSVYGWDVRDVMSLNADTERVRLHKAKNNLIFQVPEGSPEIVAISVLDTARNGNGRALTPVGAARHFGDNGRIDTLVVGVGANNALRAMIDLRLQWSQDDGYTDRQRKSAYTVWDPKHFEADYQLLADRLKEVDTNRVVFTTVPHVTIAPIAHGVGGFVDAESQYYRFYTRPWITSNDFDPSRHDHINGSDARAVDVAIDAYNRSIEHIVAEARRQGHNWLVLDASAMLDRLAVRRNARAEQRADWYEPYPLPPEVAALDLVPDARFFWSDAHGRRQGGLFSLDATHPDTLGYGLLAQELVHVMAGDGVQFARGTQIDFVPLVESSIVSDPPTNYAQVFSMLATVLKLWECAAPNLDAAAVPTRAMTGMDHGDRR